MFDEQREQPSVLKLDDEQLARVAQVLGMIPQSLYLMTSSFEGRTRAVLVSWVQQVGMEPPMVLVALRKGRNIVPMVHDSRAFVLNQIASDDRVLLRKFRNHDDQDEDALQWFDTQRGVTGSPILIRAACYIECELERHIDVDGDHDLYVGVIRDAALLNDAQTITYYRENGLAY